MIRQIQSHATAALSAIVSQLLLEKQENDRERVAKIICQEVLVSIWNLKCKQYNVKWKIHSNESLGTQSEVKAMRIANELLDSVSELTAEQLGYSLGTFYTSMLPVQKRSTLGAYYTPPVLVEKLLDNIKDQKFDFTKSKIADLSCGNGAFLIAAIKRLRLCFSKRIPKKEIKFIDKVSRNIRGYEIDSFAAWMAQVLIELETLYECSKVGKRLPSLIQVGDSLDVPFLEKNRYDLVIGNPPYGRTSLSQRHREQYSRSLYGHANLYGVFTDLALRMSHNKALIAYVTPTSFLSGQYFKSLRKLLGNEARPVAIDFVSDRAGVFDDVLQETLLVVFDKSATKFKKTLVSELIPSEVSRGAKSNSLGSFALPKDSQLPWLFPRSKEHAQYIKVAVKLSSRLRDYGYEVITGQLVWNRHKNQLSNEPGAGRIPLIWAECVSGAGQFNHKAARKNHTPFFSLLKKQEFLVTNRECALVQRTTSKEQSRRLIAAILPTSFLKKHRNGVVVENHLNIIRSIDKSPLIPLEAVVALINSITVDNIFRCISGSVAVSAYELNNLPMPNTDDLMTLISKMKKQDQILTEKNIQTLYGIEE